MGATFLILRGPWRPACAALHQPIPVTGDHVAVVGTSQDFVALRQEIEVDRRTTEHGTTSLHRIQPDAQRSFDGARPASDEDLAKRWDLDHLSAKWGHPPSGGVSSANIEHPVCSESDWGARFICPPYAGKATSGDNLRFRETYVSQKVYKEVCACFATLPVNRDAGLTKECL